MFYQNIRSIVKGHALLVQRIGIWLAVIGALIGFALVALIVWIFLAASSS
jgi:hypothetical protein